MTMSQLLDKTIAANMSSCDFLKNGGKLLTVVKK